MVEKYIPGDMKNVSNMRMPDGGNHYDPAVWYAAGGLELYCPSETTAQQLTKMKICPSKIACWAMSFDCVTSYNTATTCILDQQFRYHP